MTKKIEIDPLTHINGMGKIKVEIKDNHLHDLKFQVTTAPRFFEYLLKGKRAEEAPRIAQRICGVCSVSHHLASVKAIEDAWDVTPPETAVKLRRLMNAGGILTSHSIHGAFHAIPDIIGLPSMDRSFTAIMNRYPDVGKTALKIHAYGNKVIQATGGRIIHVVTSIPGGQTLQLKEQRRNELVEAGREVLEEIRVYADFVYDLYENDALDVSQFPATETNYMALVNGKQNERDIYNGEPCIIGFTGKELARFHPSEYSKYIREAVWEHSSAKVPYYKPEGVGGLLRVGPLARLNIVNQIHFPLAREYTERYLKLFSRTCHQVQAFNLARISELIAAQEEVLSLLEDPSILREDIRVPVKSKSGEGAAFIEAPGGVLIHHYVIDDNGLVRYSNIIAPTTFNHPLIQQDLYANAEHYASELADPATRADACWRLEKIVRAYDPCTSCGVHMVDLVDDGGMVEVKEVQ
ncbi:MAG: Ni/Fe hydrogenase subunit alpha [Candidatus Bathyarchaeota archaeon]|nr:Ni/Fe hydrogenase subunit alpha [Candidatus Bathyarchaeota archaeon]